MLDLMSVARQLGQFEWLEQLKREFDPRPSLATDARGYWAEIERADRARAGGFEQSIIPRIKGSKEFLFYGSKQASAVTTTGWMQWTRPKNATFIYIMCMGGGSGGGGGFTGASATARGGGGGGGSGAIARMIIPAWFLPKTLHLLPGCGGKGGAGSGSIGIAGGRSCITDKIATLGQAADTILVSGAAAAAGGVAGTAAGAQAGGAAETIATNLLGIYMGLAAGLVFIAGQAGTAAGALGVAGTALTFGSVGIPLTGGTGGGSVTTTNTDVAGGAISGVGLIPTIPGGLAAAGNGQNGVPLEFPWISTGGTGGGTAGAAGTAGKGGDASTGSGGGGGGSGVTGGAGGAGGEGLIMMVAF